MTVNGNLNLPQVRKITKVNFPKSVKVRSNLLGFDLNQNT